MQVMGLIEELAESGTGERRPAESPLAEGRWRLRWSAQVMPVLLFTSFLPDSHYSLSLGERH